MKLSSFETNTVWFVVSLIPRQVPNFSVDHDDLSVLPRHMAKYDSRLDRMFSALGDPTRRMIVARLARGRASVGELAAPHDMALPSLLGHLKKLEEAGLITSTKVGRVRTCALAPDAMVPAQDWLSEQRAVWDGRLDRFDTYVTSLKKERTNGPESKD